MARELAKYEAEGQQITITDVDVRKVLCDNPNVTDAEMKMFVELCKAHKLNPFIKEAYLVKYGDKPATIVTGKDTFMKRAFRNPRFKGLEAGVTVINRDGFMERRPGSMVGGKTERLIGGWCRVHVDGYEVPMYDEVSLEEYMGRKRDGSPNGQWAKMPGTMVRKVAIVHALREAFPEDLGGMYDSSEMGVEIPQQLIEVRPESVQEAPQQPRPAHVSYYENESDSVANFDPETGEIYEQNVVEMGAF